ncbi:MAG: DUF1343 domain-containing protein, partial [Spirochaetia bacterium]|nr:DUF1343 domain-containing protein [Spirochaetia bacterium]
ALHEAGRSLTVYVVDRPNPAGRSVEGTRLPAAYESFVGMPGILHRHGLTLGELLTYVHSSASMRYPLIVQKFAHDGSDGHGSAVYAQHKADGEAPSAPRPTWIIAPSPNMPSPVTPLVYSGQCLLEGTNMSEGRGTTRPFEIFGAPYLDWSGVPSAPGAVLRPLMFIPTFHKHKDEVCRGFQIHVTGPYHSLLHTLRILRWARETFETFSWREGVYEFRSDRPAIELLCGDPILTDYVSFSEFFRSGLITGFSRRASCARSCRCILWNSLSSRSTSNISDSNVL